MTQSCSSFGCLCHPNTLWLSSIFYAFYLKSLYIYGFSLFVFSFTFISFFSAYRLWWPMLHKTLSFYFFLLFRLICICKDFKGGADGLTSGFSTLWLCPALPFGCRCPKWCSSYSVLICLYFYWSLNDIYSFTCLSYMFCCFYL